MSDIRQIKFNSFMCKRLELQDDAQIKGYTDSLRTVATAMLSHEKMILIAPMINKLLVLLHRSAIANNDSRTILQAEEICGEILEATK